jgi:hypothetical protein
MIVDGVYFGMADRNRYESAGRARLTDCWRFPPGSVFEGFYALSPESKKKGVPH